MAMKLTDIKPFADKLVANMETVIVGKRPTLEWVTIGLLCQGHILIEDVPGVGKTMLARSLARSLGCTFKRLQFTPDMLPSDVTGVSIYNQAARKFEYRPGPIMTQILLADEINRATPKTQSALLEGMEEHQVTVDGITYPLPNPFMVLGTQNPIEYEGTFPLPEAQLDRFLMRVRIGYPSLHEEMHVLELQQLRHPIENLKPLITLKELQQAQEIIKTVFVSPAIKRYIVDLVRATREHPDIYLGSSPRGSLGLSRAGQVRAAMLGRDHILPDDIKALSTIILPHRIIVNPAARLRNLTSEKVIAEIISELPIPTGDVTKG
ncbi:MAG: MoxR family ATPase [Anaerolineaceae bacterium]